MHKIIIYIGTSARDLTQYTMLLNSIRAYNVDKIPVYTCVKDSDFELFEQTFKNYDVTFIKDSDVYNTPVNNAWYKQQLIKMNFWKLGISEFVLQMDSDSFFIRDFRISDFLVDENTPYTILHEHKELKEFFARYNLHDSKRHNDGEYKIAQGFGETSDRIKEVFGTTNRTADYDYGHTPLIINTKVWKVLYDEYIQPNDISYESLLEYAGNDQQWYGEALLAFDVHRIYPKENLFKTFHYPTNYEEFKKMDKLDDLKYNYYGLCVQSNWCPPGSPAFNEIYSRFFTSKGHPKLFNGQFEEDKWIAENIELPEYGVVIDVGADQPIHGSNTYFFEKVLGWKSVCIDADERVLDKLRKYRSNVVHSIVSSYDGVGKFLQRTEAGISHVSSAGNSEVPSKTLNSILEENQIEEVTLLDIDVEGHELEVCQGLDWDKYRPKIVVIEFISPAGGNIESSILEYFNKIGSYKLVHKTTANLIFVRNETVQ
jgi:FkbM family methyltransferase